MNRPYSDNESVVSFFDSKHESHFESIIVEFNININKMNDKISFKLYNINKNVHFSTN